MLKRTLIILALISISGTGYFTYQKWVKNANLSVWSFIPENAIFIYENNHTSVTLDEVSEIDTWKTRALHHVNFNCTNPHSGSAYARFLETQLLIWSRARWVCSHFSNTKRTRGGMCRLPGDRWIGGVGNVVYVRGVSSPCLNIYGNRNEVTTILNAAPGRDAICGVTF